MKEDIKPTTPSEPDPNEQLGGVDRIIPPEEYILAPGDVLVLTLSGALEDEYYLKIGADGNISVPDLGLMKAGGISLALFREKLAERADEVYAGVEHSLGLDELHYTKTQITGAIVEPGWYSFHGPVHVSEAVQQAGGLLPNGSQKNVEIQRSLDGTLVKVDLRAVYDGVPGAEDPYIQPGDTINIPPMKQMVELSGQVYREGMYELTEGETLLDLILQAGGLTVFVDERVAYIERDEERIHLDIHNIYFKNREDLAPQLQAGDKVFIGRIPKSVYVVGGVNNAGPVEYDQNMGILDYIGEAGGAVTGADLASTVIIRGALDDIQKVGVDVKSLYKGDSQAQNPPVRPGDFIVVPTKGSINYQAYLSLILSGLSISNYFD